MPPRRSTAAGEGAVQPSAKPRQSLKRKSISTTALEQVEALLPASCTPGYVPPDSREGEENGRRRRSTAGKVGGREAVLSEEEKAALLVETLGFQPTELLQDITESARQQVDKTVLTIENWLSKVVRLSAAGTGKGSGKSGQGGEDEMMLEVDQGLHGLETLLNDHMDTALDKLTSWALRNTFEIPDELRLTLPWHEGLDFDRGTYVAGLPEGELAVQKNIEELREQVENMRKLHNGLTLADRAVEGKVKALQRQKEAIGFITSLAKGLIVPASGTVKSLPDTAHEITTHMDTLYHDLSNEFGAIVPTPTLPSGSTGTTDPFSTSTTSAGGTAAMPGAGAAGTTPFTREWEFGRAAYLSWAVSRARALVEVDTDTNADDAVPGAGTMTVDGEQKRLDELLALTREVSGPVAVVGGPTAAAASGGQSTQAQGAQGMGWALQALLKRDLGTTGAGGESG
ncbi:hypothetical protein QFC19_001230 [Naganishia cerealis]|uniref:Uncharacterized protein n=1 Tax=Naganishia cerealis TaxID=610337 RepID=A0ACC2WKV9_9TREE|nr:hypothetical protein QFC19_001230 [Naganishia cerealis]